MKRTTTLFMLFFAFCLTITNSKIYSSTNQLKGNVDVTFQVDMQNQTVSGDVHLAGNFASAGYSDWTAEDITMTLQGGTVYETTLSLPTGSTFSYKFINASNWETVPSSCGIDDGTGNYNREVTVGSNAQTIDLVCYANCGACQTPVEVTFSVDMSNETISSKGIHMAGNFGSDGYPDWNPGGIELSDVGNNIYETTLNLTQNATYEYKFVNGDSWGEDETVPSECNTNNNRTFSTTTTNLELSTYYYASCNINSSDPVDVTFNVNMKKQIREGNFDKTSDNLKLAINGGSTYILTDADNDSIFTYVLTDQTPEAELEYRYQINSTVESNYASTYRKITLTSSNNSTTAWYNDDPLLKTITFQVNMSKQIYDEAFDAENHTVQVLGSFTDWQMGSPITCTNTGSNNIFEVTADLPLDDAIEYKFRMVRGENDTLWESRANRTYTVIENNAPLSCWFDDATLLTNVIFQANMIKQIREGNFDEASDKLYLEQSSAKTIIELTDSDGDSIYTDTLVDILTGSVINYNYYINSIKEDVDQRTYTVKANDNSIFDWYNNDTILKTVVFKVNMNQQIILGNFNPETDLVDIGANFNNYGETPVVLNDDDSIGIYKSTVQLGLKQPLAFKYRINGSWESAELSGQDNRTGTVAENNNTFSFWYDDNEPSEIQTDVVSFALAEQIKPCYIDTDNFIISGEVNKTASLAELIPTFSLSAQASAYISESRIYSEVTAVDFSDTVILSVVGMDGETSQDWKIAISKEKNTEAFITDFIIETQTGNATINQEDLTIQVELLYGSDKTALTPEVTLSENATVIPDGSTPIDFTKPVTYTVTSEDEKTVNEYLVTVNVADTIYTGNAFTSFSLSEQTKPSIIDSTALTVTGEVFFGADLTTLTPAFTISLGAQVSPSTGIITDYSEPVVYTITSQTGDTAEWTVNVTEAKNCETEILSFSIPEEIAPAQIDRTNKIINLSVERLTDVTALVPSFILSEQAKAYVNNVEQISAETTNDFTESLVYEVIAGNDTCSQNWTVNVTVNKNTSAELLSYSIDGGESEPWDTTHNIITIRFPEGTDCTNMVSEFTISEGASIQVNETEQISGETTNDFSNPVQYKIVSEDGLTESFWLVKTELIVGIDNATSALKIYPNPAYKNVWISSTQTIVSVTILNTMGQIIIKNQINAQQSELNISTIQQGVYFIKTEDASGNCLIKKLIIR